MWRNFKHLFNDFYINFINNQRHSFYYVNPFEFVESYLRPRKWFILWTCLCFWKLSWLIVLFKLFIYWFSIYFVPPISKRGVVTFVIVIVDYSLPFHSYQFLSRVLWNPVVVPYAFGFLCSPYCRKIVPLYAGDIPYSGIRLFWYSSRQFSFPLVSISMIYKYPSFTFNLCVLLLLKWVSCALI